MVEEKIRLGHNVSMLWIDGRQICIPRSSASKTMKISLISLTLSPHAKFQEIILSLQQISFLTMFITPTVIAPVFGNTGEVLT